MDSDDLTDALKEPASRVDSVRWQRPDGVTELLLYGPDGDGGTLIIPAELMDFTPPA